MASSLVQFRTDDATKTKAANICEKLGIDLQTYMRMCIARLIQENGIPFRMNLPVETPAAYGSLTKEQFDAEIEKGITDVREGRIYSADAVEAEMKRDFGI